MRREQVHWPEWMVPEGVRSQYLERAGRRAARTGAGGAGGDGTGELTAPAGSREIGAVGGS
jgi:hypothetical protein